MDSALRAAVLVVAVLAVSFPAATTPGAAGVAVPSNAAGATQSDEPIDVTVRIEKTDDPGRVVITYRYSVNSGIAMLSVWPPYEEAMTVLETRGFDATGRGNYRWEHRDGEEPYLRVEVDMDEDTLRTNSPGVDPGPWALVVHPLPDTRYFTGTWRQYEGTPTVTAGEDEVANGRDIAFVGEHTVHTRTASSTGETFRLVVPEAGSLEPAPGAVLSSLVNASETLDVGNRYDETYAFVVPRSIESEHEGAIPSSFSAGGTDRRAYWVKSDRPMDDADNTWLHEYVHARQGWTSGQDFWLDEGSASYLEAVLALDQGWAAYDEFVSRLHSARDRDAVLADPSTWARDSTQYEKGAVVFAAVDAHVREETNHERTILDVFRRLNEREGEVTNQEFVAAVEATTGDSRSGSLADKYTTTSEMPEVPIDPAVYAIPGHDADGDGLDSGAERRLGTSPFERDTDGDGIDDDREVDRPTDVTVADTDGDDYPDGMELERGTDPTLVDTDGDGLDDTYELARPPSPTDADTDGDGFSDAEEVGAETDPVDEDDFPSTEAGEGREASKGSQRQPIGFGGGGVETGVRSIVLAVPVPVLWLVGGVSGLLAAVTLASAGLRRGSGRSPGGLDRRSIRWLAGALLVAFALSLAVAYLQTLFG